MARPRDPAGARRPRHVAWVWTRSEPDAGGTGAVVLRSLAEHALGCGIEWLTVQIPEERLVHSVLLRLTLPGAVALVPIDASVRKGATVGGDASARAGLAPPGPGGGSPLDGEETPGSPLDGDEMPGSPLLRLVLTTGASGRRGFVDALARLAEASGSPEVDERAIDDLIGVPDVDLLVLTGGDRHLPDLLLWQVVYSEIVVIDDPWLALGSPHFEEALDEYARRERRYGGLATGP